MISIRIHFPSSKLDNQINRKIILYERRKPMANLLASLFGMRIIAEIPEPYLC